MKRSKKYSMNQEYSFAHENERGISFCYSNISNALSLYQFNLGFESPFQAPKFALNQNIDLKNPKVQRT